MANYVINYWDIMKRYNGMRKDARIVNHKFVKIINESKRIIAKMFKVAEVLSTLAIFAVMLLFVVGRIGVKYFDDDLTMNAVRSQIASGLSISKIKLVDLHGFGNDTMIVLANTDSYADNTNQAEVNNQIIILDKIENDILNQMNNLFGYGSNYMLSYLFSLKDAESLSYFGYELEVFETIDLTGDASKEIVLFFKHRTAGTDGAFKIGIISYSYTKRAYYMLGTLPPADYYDRNENHLVETLFHSPIVGERTYFNYEEETGEVSKRAYSEIANIDTDSQLQENKYGNEKSFQLEYSYLNDNDFFITCGDGTVLLVRAKKAVGGSEHHTGGAHHYIISIFEPEYDIERDELLWRVVSSKMTSEKIYGTRTEIENFIIQSGWDWSDFWGTYLPGNEFD